MVQYWMKNSRCSCSETGYQLDEGLWINSMRIILDSNVDHVFEADECDAFDSDVDEGPTTQTMFMANLTSEDPIYDEAGPSYDSNTPFEVQDHDTFVNHMDEYHEVHEMQSDVQHNYVVDSDADYTSDSNIIPYDQYVEDNEEHVVQSNVSSVRNDALMSILDEMHEQGVQSRLANKPNMVVKDSVTSELARYKELVGEYEKRAKFELTDRERKIDEQMRIIISDRNRKETSLKSELHSAQILLSSTVGHYKSKTEEVTILKKDFKQKEDKFLEEFLDIKRLKEKVEDRLYKQDQSVQTVHMLCKPKSFYDEKNKVAIGYKNPLCLTRAKQVQPALYNGHVLVMSNHARPVVHDSEDTREIAEITRKRMLLKMQSPLCVENKVRIAPPDYSKENLLATFAPQRNLTPEQIFWSIDDNDRKKAETSVPKPISALTVYPPNTPVKLVPRVLPTKRVQTALFKEVKVMEEIFDQMNNEVDKNTVDKQCAKIVNKNHLIENENLIANCLSNQLLYDVEKSRCLDLEAEMSKKAPDFNSFFKIKNLEHQIEEKDNVIRDLKVLVANVNDRSCQPYNDKEVTALIEQNDYVRVELEKVKQHYKELYDSIKITRAHTSEKTSTMLNELESLKAQLRSKVSCFTSNSVKPKVLAPRMYAIDVNPIPHPLKNNRSVHLNYINHLKESVETVREIVEEARVVKPLDNALNYACQYTKLSQELLEYVIGTCPKSFNERDNKAPSNPVTRKKQVIFSDKPGTSSSNTQKHKVHQKVQRTNIPVIPSTGVNTSTEASGSKPRSNTKKNRILPTKSENKKKVEDHLRINKSVWTKVNRADSSISSKRVVINSNSESVCKTCNKCLNSANHEMCVVNILSSVNATPTVKIVLNKGKQIWKPKGKLSDNSLNKTKRVWKATGKLFADIGYQWRPTGKKFTLGKLNCGYQWRPTGKKFALGELCPLTKLSVKCRTGHPLVIRPGCSSKKIDGESFKAQRTLWDKVHRDSLFGNITLELSGLGDYVNCVISRVYYVEGLGHNLFSVGQFCDSDLEIAFRKHSCFVRDMNDVDLLKGRCSTNLYMISIDDMMKASLVCLLSKASKIKSWLWHRCLNHLNFETINDLARKDLVRGLPRLKFEKDHLCSACQLGKSKKFSHKPKSENTNMEVLHTLHMDLCGPMRDETPKFVINFLKQIQVGLNKIVRYIRTDNGTEFVNQVMSKYYEGVGIFHQKSVPRTPQQNGVVERRNRTLVEAARTMLIFSKAPMFLWAAAVATACYTQNRSLIHTRHNKTPYELVHDKKPDLTFLRVFGALCYPTNDSEDLGKLQAKADIGIFVGYAPNRKGFRIYNKRTRRIMETIHVTFDELLQTMAPVHISSGPEPMSMTPGQFSSGLIPNQVNATNYVLPTDKDLELLFQPMFDEYFEVTRVDAPVPSATAVNAHVVPPEILKKFDFANVSSVVHHWDSVALVKDEEAISITPDLPIEEPDNSLNMGDEHLDTIPATESDEVIKSSVENLVPILSEFEVMSDDTSDVPNCYNNRINVESDLLESLINRDTSIDYSSKIDPIFEEFAGELAHIAPIPPGIVEADFDSNDDTSSDDDDFEDIEYVSLEEVNEVDQEKEEFDLDDILQIQDVILREKLLNVSRLISNIESLKDNPIPIMDSDSSETSLSFSDNSLPEFESFSDHTEETRSGSTTTHANYSLPEYESFHFDNPSLPRPPPEPPDIEILKPEINNFDVLYNDESFEPRGDENVAPVLRF
ncbi:retrovirus-related pol polyprotein from transposon TNT 1-94 [Tanacetum coccineum]